MYLEIIVQSVVLLIENASISIVTSAHTVLDNKIIEPVFSHYPYKV